MKRFLLFFCFTTFFVSESDALIIDTTLVGTNSPGPYPLGWHFVDPSSITAKFADSSRGQTPPFVYIEEENGLLFSESIDSGVVIQIHYTTHFFGIQKIYYLYERHVVSPNDTVHRYKADAVTPLQRFTSGDLSISGFKSIGISFGSQGQTNLEQALEVQIYGEIRPNTILSANLSDQGTSLEGDTREIGEIDRMYVSLENPRYSIVIGDQHVSIPPNSLIEGQKKIKGLSAGYQTDTFHSKAWGAISGGKFTVQTIQGQLGFQGPYFLTGKGEADLITPIAGTIKVIVDGKELKEGPKNDYIVDYEMGAIRFMPSFAIDDESIIQVQYEYKAFDYQRIFLGTDIGAGASDSSLKIDGVFWYETDNKDHPIDIAYTDAIIDSLKQSGDRIPLVPAVREIHPNDVAPMDSKYRLYKKTGNNPVTTDTVFQYHPYDSKNPDDKFHYFQVWFRQVDQGGGDYKEYTVVDSAVITITDSLFATIENIPLDSIKRAIQKCIDPSQPLHYQVKQLSLTALDDILNAITDLEFKKELDKTLKSGDPRGPVYVYIGKNKGNYTIYDKAFAPKRTMKGICNISVSPRDYVNFSTQIAGQVHDENIFSEKDDDDNTAGAAKSTFTIGQQRFDERGVWIHGEHLFSSSRFSRELLSLYEKKVLWDRETTPLSEKMINIWRLHGGMTFIPGISTHVSYGQFIRSDSLYTQRLGYGIRLSPKDQLSLAYAGKYLHHFHASNGRYYRGDTITFSHDAGYVNYSVYANDQWREDTLSTGRGSCGAGTDIFIKPLSLKESFYYAKDLKLLPHDDIFDSKDTGSTFLWEQKINLSPSESWKINGTSSYRQRIRHHDTTSVLLVSVTNDIASVRHGFSTNQGYQLSSEKASTYVQVPIYVGKGNGTHSFDTLTNEYVPDRNGDYIIVEQEIFDNGSNDQIRKSRLTANWFFRPQTKKIYGILADLSWNGSVGIDEHINNRYTRAVKSWIPGYTSLFKGKDSAVTYADLFYRQNVTWRPSFTQGLTGALFARPYLRKVRRLKENGLEWGIELDKAWSRFQLGIEGRMHMLHRKGNVMYTRETQIRDNFLLWKQRYYFIPQTFSFFMKEVIGQTARDTLSGPYYKLQPGLSLQLYNKGWAEFSYTWSRVDEAIQVEYPMAQGFSSGTSHIMECLIDINAGEHFSIGGNYRSESSTAVGPDWLHIFSLEIKAYL